MVFEVPGSPPPPPARSVLHNFCALLVQGNRSNRSFCKRFLDKILYYFGSTGTWGGAVAPSTWVYFKEFVVLAFPPICSHFSQNFATLTSGKVGQLCSKMLYKMQEKRQKWGLFGPQCAMFSRDNSKFEPKRSLKLGKQRPKGQTDPISHMHEGGLKVPQKVGRRSSITSLMGQMVL